MLIIVIFRYILLTQFCVCTFCTIVLDHIKQPKGGFKKNHQPTKGNVYLDLIKSTNPLKANAFCPHHIRRTVCWEGYEACFCSVMCPWGRLDH